jgi:hypothetical protein
MYIEHIKKNPNLDLLRDDVAEAKEVKEDDQGLWATFVELEILIKDIPTLIGFCFDYMPSSIEIIEPKELKLKDVELSNIMNDLQAKLHKLDMAVKQLSNENRFLKKNTFFLATNLVSILLKAGARKLGDLARLSGMSDKDMEGFLEKLIKQGFVKKEGEEYIWTKENVKREEQG